MLLVSTCVRCLLCQDYEQYRPSSWLTEVEPKSSPYYPQVGDAVSRVICEESISSLIPEQCSEEVHCAVQYWHINLKCNMVLHLSILCGDVLGHLWQCILVPATYSTYVRLCSLVYATYCGWCHSHIALWHSCFIPFPAGNVLPAGPWAVFAGG